MQRRPSCRGRDVSRTRPFGAAPPVPRRSPRRLLYSVVAEGRQAVGAGRWHVAPRVAERSWAPARPVLKHGPRSLTGPRVKGPFETPRHNEGEGRFGRPRWDPLRGRTTAPPYPLCSVWRRQSGHARTRKMVNYARAGRSQRKLWWRSAAILTCKSIVKLGYRGERLIEPSSSWFLPKFPSG